MNNSVNIYFCIQKLTILHELLALDIGNRLITCTNERAK